MDRLIFDCMRQDCRSTRVASDKLREERKMEDGERKTEKAWK